MQGQQTPVSYPWVHPWVSLSQTQILFAGSFDEMATIVCIWHDRFSLDSLQVWASIVAGCELRQSELSSNALDYVSNSLSPTVNNYIDVDIIQRTKQNILL